MTCRAPTGNLWLLLEEGDLFPNGWSRWLNLETSEVREMERSSAELLKWGWQVVE